MKYSHLFGKTIKDTPKDATLVSHKFLYQAGYIRESTAGRYYLLPLGWKVQQKVQAIIREEMDKAGAQEMITPVMHPKSLWQETNRTTSAGFELMSVKDRSNTEFVLGGTAEEMLVDLVRKFQVSYKDLPFNLYQFSTKFRDEKRARGGLLRLREFLMKDAYSFHADELDFKREYQHMRETYQTIFNRLGLTTIVVESDNGYIGGEYCHEFVVESEAGESKFLTTQDGSYAAHEDVAIFEKYKEKSNEPLNPMKEVEGVGIIGVEALAEYLHIPVEKTTKTILFETETGDVVAAAVMGLYDINETKLKNILHCTELKLARPEVVKKVTGAAVGYAGFLNLLKQVKVILDESLKGRKNFECGANRTNYHTINVNFGRDIAEPQQYYDIALAKEGYLSKDGKKLFAKRGIEVGNIFQLGFHYSSKMEGASFTTEDGSKKPYYMGCYGIGVARTMATIVEKFADEKGLVWPEQVTPFTVHLIDVQEKERAQEVYECLMQHGIEILWDDRNARAGEKFADADLLGIPHRLVVSAKTGDKVEWKERTSTESTLLSLEEVIKKLKKSDLFSRSSSSSCDCASEQRHQCCCSDNDCSSCDC